MLEFYFLLFYYYYFLASDCESRLMRESYLSIYIESGNLYYKGRNARESFYDFVLSQKDTARNIATAKVHYGGTFEHYLTEFLASLDADTDARLDTLTNKNIKYFFYRFNDFLLFRGLEPSNIVHTKLSADEIVMERLQNRDWQSNR